MRRSPGKKNTPPENRDIEKSLHSIQDFSRETIEASQKRIVGQTDNLQFIINAFLTGGHVLISGLPGLGKTLTVKTIASLWNYEFKRIQFTPDTVPSDITGSEVLIEKVSKNGARSYSFDLMKGPLFTNILLADEINRTPPKTQSSMLQAMEENEVTIGNQSIRLPDPFFVLATKNPIELEGTYPLPEAQLDRFTFSLDFLYPDHEEEKIIAQLNDSEENIIQPVHTAIDLHNWRKALYQVPVPENILEKLIRSVRNTRPSKENQFALEYADYGAGPRATQMLLSAAKAQAVIDADFIVNENTIEKIFIPVLKHRIILNYNAVAEKISIETFLKECLQM